MTTTAPIAQRPPTEVQQLVADLGHDCAGELAAVARLAAALLRTPVASVNAVDGAWLHQLATVGTRDRAPRAESICVRVLETAPGPFACADLSADPAFAGNPWVDGRRAAVRGYASAPLRVDGEVVGALCVVDDVPHEFSAADRAGLADLALLAGAVLERRGQARTAVRLAADSEQAREELESTVAELAAAHAELTRTEAFAQGLLEVLPVGVVAVDAEGRRVLVNGVTRRWHDEAEGGSATVDTSPSGHFLCADGVTPMPREELPLIRSLTGSGIAHTEAVLVHPGRPARRLSITSSPISSLDGTLLGSVAAMTDVTRQRELEDRLRAAALHDALTGLPNRVLLVDRLEHALRACSRDGAPVALLFCDLDGFKAVNDAHGHTAGDAVLVEVARRLAAVVRPGDTVGRLGGDEFVVLCPGAGTPTAAAAIATRIGHALRAPVDLGTGVQVSVGVSVGVALSGPGDGPQQMLDRADEGMYAVKQERRVRAGR